MRARRLATGGLLAAVVAIAAPALAAPNKGYEVDVGGTALRGQPVTFTVMFYAPAKQELGSAKLTAPDDFIVTSVVADAALPPLIEGGSVTLNALEIPAGGQEKVTVRAMVPCKSTDAMWEVKAKQANEFNGTGNDLQLDAGRSELETPLIGACEPCPENQACKATQNNGNNKFTVTGLPDAQEPDQGQVTLAFGSGLDISCADHTPVMSDTALFNVTGERTKTASLVVPRRSLPAGGYEALDLCFGSPDADALPGAVEQGTYDWDGDGVPEPVYVGLLPDCAEADDTTCVFNRDRLPGNDGIIEARLPAGDPGMRG